MSNTAVRVMVLPLETTERNETMNLDRPSLRLTVFILSLCFATKARALYSVMETGDILSEGSYKASLESQFISDGDRGVNLIGRFDSWFNQDANLRAVVGSGTTDFYAGGFFKWVPYPDTEGQPAIGLSSGIIYARYDGFDSSNKNEDIDEISLRFHPLISKKIKTEIGEMNSYASIPIGISSREGEGKFPVQLTGGVEWKTEQWKNITFTGEVGFNVHEAFSYFSLGARVQWDKENGLSLD